MDRINHIKESRNEEGLSINQIAKNEGINWRTAKKYADSDILPKERKRTRSGMMYDDGWHEIINYLLFLMNLVPSISSKRLSVIFLNSNRKSSSPVIIMLSFSSVT